MNSAATLNASKTYRASQRIAGEHKNCGFCRDRISVGMPVQFVPNRGAWHAACVKLLEDHMASPHED